MQAVIFFAFFLLVDLFGLADFVVFLGNGVIHGKQRRYETLKIIFKGWIQNQLNVY